MRTNLEGTDPLPVPIPLTGCSTPACGSRNMVAADVARIVCATATRAATCTSSQPTAHGASTRSAGSSWSTERPVRHDRQGGADTRWRRLSWMEQYLPQFDSWLPVTTAADHPVPSGGVSIDGRPLQERHLHCCTAYALSPARRRTATPHYPGWVTRARTIHTPAMAVACGPEPVLPRPGTGVVAPATRQEAPLGGRWHLDRALLGAAQPGGALEAGGPGGLPRRRGRRQL